MKPRLWIQLCSVIALAGCAGAGTPGHSGFESRDDPARTRWAWISTQTPAERIEVRAPERYTLSFVENARVEVRFDCNQGGGSYRLEGHRLSFGPLRSTRMACPPDSQDSLFIRDLDRVDSYFLENGRLFMELEMHGGTMIFAPAVD